MAVAHRASATPTGNPTTSFTVTIPASVLTDDDLYVFVCSRDHTAATAYPTVTDNDTGGNTWTRIAESTDRKATLWRKKATSGSASKTVTVSGCVGSASGGISAYSGGASGDPTTNIAVEDNASGDESHAGFTPSFADSMICLAVFNTGNDNAVTVLACTNPGTLEPERFEKLSTGGSDCATIHGSALQSGGPTATGSFTWAQTNGTTKSIVFAIKPALIVSPGSVASAEAHGSTKINLTVSPTGIASAEAHGSTTISSASPQTISPTGIASVEAHGSTKINQSIAPTGIASGEASGSPQINLQVRPNGITSGEAHGSPTVNRTLSPTSIASGELHGAPKVNLTVSPAGIPSAEVHGNTTVSAAGGAQTISPTGIPSAEAHGSPRLEVRISPTGIPSLEIHGLLSITVGEPPGPPPVAVTPRRGPPLVGNRLRERAGFRTMIRG